MGCLKLNIENRTSLRVLNGGKSLIPKSCKRTYWFGYNGMEKDMEIKGDGNSYTTEFRQYDPRLGRWLSLDPLMMMFPDMSPYVAFANNPIYYTDPYGLAPVNGDPPPDDNPEVGGTCVDEAGEVRKYEGDGVWSDGTKNITLPEITIMGKKISPPIADQSEKKVESNKNWDSDKYFYSKFMPTLMSHEGGYTNNSNDKGNYDNGKLNGKLIGTKYGISAPVLQTYLKKDLTPDDMKNLTKSTATQIYKTNYWDKPKIGLINDKDVAEQLADFYVNAGGNAIKSIQKALNVLGEDVVVDGAIGNNTIKAINRVDPKKLHEELKKQRISFYTKIGKGSNAGFLKGWLNRANSFKYGD